MDPNDRKTRRLKRRESVTGRNIRPCDSFKPNVWRPNKCANCFFTDAEHTSGASPSAPQIQPKDLKRLEDLLAAGIIQEAEFERRKAELANEAAQLGTGQVLRSSSGRIAESTRSPSPSRAASSSSAASSSAVSSLSLPDIGSVKIDVEAAELAEDVLAGIIVVFFADGSARYNEMTAYALRTFIDATPRIMVGLLTRDEATSDAILGTLARSQRHRVLPKLVRSKPHFDDWNPTQYKLDIVQYAEAFETIFWFDSDTITFGDMTDFLTAFAASDARFYMTPDHVNSDQTFLKSWTSKIGNLVVIPQACLMGFKTEIITHFFTFWEAIWKHWITPQPFANFPDPNPSFEGSAFCIEQYALGQALAYKEEWIRDVMWFRRQFIAVPKNGNKPVDTLPSRAVSVAPILKLLSAQPNALVDIKELRSVRIPPKTKYFVSNSIVASEDYDYIDRFANLYHCYNHSYARVKQWYQHFSAHGDQSVPK